MGSTRFETNAASQSPAEDKILRADRIERALGYPYPAPERSFLFTDGGIAPIDGADLTNRLPVLAFGSNRSPEQLARKYANWPAGTMIPVTTASLSGWDVVYGSHITSYGSLPAALYPSGGTTVSIAITWLTDRQLQRMHETEGPQNYAFAGLDAPAIIVDGSIGVDVSGGLASIHYYRPLHRPLLLDGAPVALSAVRADGRHWQAMSQVEIQTRLRDRLSPGSTLEEFIWDGVADPAVRNNRTDLIRSGDIAAS